MYTCVRFSLLPSLFVKQFYLFVLRYFFGSRSFSLLFPFVSFLSLLSSSLPSLATLSVKNNFLWWVVNHCPLFFVSCSFIFHASHLSFSFLHSKLVDNSSPGTELYLKNIHSICILHTTAIRHRHHHHLRHLAWTSQAYCVYASLSVSLASLLVIPSSRRRPSSITLRLSSTPWCSVIQHSLIHLTPITVVVPVISSDPRPWTPSHTFSLFLIIYHTLCYTVLAYSLCCSLCSGYACICWRTNKNS